MSDDTHKIEVDQKGMDNLTEVLRLQAETLSRIAERMAGPQAGTGGPALLPPPRGEPTGTHLPALADDPSLSSESLPVLNAFRKFLDAERRRARQRILWTTLIFAVVLAGALAAIVYLGRSHVDELKSDIRFANQNTAEFKKELADQAVADAEFKKRMADTASGLKHDVGRSFVAAQSNLTSQMSARDAEIERMRDTISSLQIENAMLVGQVKDVIKKTEQMQAEASPAATAEAEPAATEPAVPAAPPELEPEPTNSLPEPRADAPVVFGRPGGKAIQFRLPPAP